MGKVPSRLFVLFKSSNDLGKPSENKEGSQHDSPPSDVNLQKNASPIPATWVTHIPFKVREKAKHRALQYLCSSESCYAVHLILRRYILEHFLFANTQCLLLQLSVELLTTSCLLCARSPTKLIVFSTFSDAEGKNRSVNEPERP